MRFFSRNCEIGFCSYMQQHLVHIGIELCLPFCSLGVHILLLVMGNKTRASDILCTRSTTQLSPVFHIVLSQIIFLCPCFTSLQCFHYNFRNIFTIFSLLILFFFKDVLMSFSAFCLHSCICTTCVLCLQSSGIGSHSTRIKKTEPPDIGARNQTWGHFSSPSSGFPYPGLLE